MGLSLHESAALSCIAFSYAARIQPAPTRKAVTIELRVRMAIGSLCRHCTVKLKLRIVDVLIVVSCN